MASPSPDPSKPSPGPGPKPGGTGRMASMDATASRTSTAATAPIPDEDHGSDLPLTMSASVVLTGLPRDTHEALADVEAIDKGKGMGYLIILRLLLFYRSPRLLVLYPMLLSISIAGICNLFFSVHICSNFRDPATSFHLPRAFDIFFCLELTTHLLLTHSRFP
jgi:hypothetical protein